MDYNQKLKEQFKDLVINLIKHDNSSSGLPCYIEVQLGKTPKNKGSMALDLGNYIFRTFNLSYQTCPEYVGKGKKATLRFYMSWNDIKPIIPNIHKALDCKIKRDDYLPFGFRSLIIQNSSRGVSP